MNYMKVTLFIALHATNSVLKFILLTGTKRRVPAIFGVNEDVNLTFSVDNSLTKEGMDGYTKFPGGSAFFFDAKIELNPWVLQNSTKEYILVTMLHEAIHSYINYWYNQYLTKQIDSTIFKSRFFKPIIIVSRSNSRIR